MRWPGSSSRLQWHGQLLAGLQLALDKLAIRYRPEFGETAARRSFVLPYPSHGFGGKAVTTLEMSAADPMRTLMWTIFSGSALGGADIRPNGYCEY
jgi:hypothetical protein